MTGWMDHERIMFGYLRHGFGGAVVTPALMHVSPSPVISWPGCLTFGHAHLTQRIPATLEIARGNTVQGERNVYAHSFMADRMGCGVGTGA